MTKRFGGLVANDRLSLTVNAGEVMALIGPNGAGKSTMFNCISGLSPASAGKIAFLGQSTVAMLSRDIARQGMSRTFQHVRLLGQMSVLENVAIGGHLRGSKGIVAAALRLDRSEENRLLAEAARQIERVGLAEHMFEPAGSLALGQQRIVEIARALCSDPCLLFLDEPAAGLAPLIIKEIFRIIAELKQTGVAILLVEQNARAALQIADYGYVLETGEVSLAGPSQELAADPRVIEAYLGLGKKH